MRVHGIANLLTLNAKDFRRFSGITVLAPNDVLAPSASKFRRECNAGGDLPIFASTPISA